MDIEQFEQRFLPLQGQLYRQAFSLLRNEADAKDAVQETYLRIWRRADDVVRMENPEGYFSHSLHNICMNMIRSRRNLHGLDVVESKIKDEEEEYREQISPEELSLLRKAISRLSPKARDVINMRYFGEMTSAEIAEILEETDTNVRSTLSRARSRLRLMLLEGTANRRRWASIIVIVLLITGTGIWMRTRKDTAPATEPQAIVEAIRPPSPKEEPQDKEEDTGKQETPPVRKRLSRRTLPHKTETAIAESQPSGEIDFAAEMSEILTGLHSLEQEIN